MESFTTSEFLPRAVLNQYLLCFKIDRIDQLGCKEVKESIFQIEARESEQQKIASLGLQSHQQSTIDVQVS